MKMVNIHEQHIKSRQTCPIFRGCTIRIQDFFEGDENGRKLYRENDECGLSDIARSQTLPTIKALQIKGDTDVLSDRQINADRSSCV
jgi:hypothetical protein